jgi:hypothetical protein
MTADVFDDGDSRRFPIDSAGTRLDNGGDVRRPRMQGPFGGQHRERIQGGSMTVKPAKKGKKATKKKAAKKR